jgi:hypothetical protein
MGWLIRKVTRSDYSHAFIVLDGYPGHEIILEAEPTGARITRLSKYAGLKMVESPDKIGISDQRMIDLAISTYVEVPYGFADIGLLGLKLTSQWVPGWVTRWVVSMKTMICSQLVAQFGADFGVDWSCGQPDPQLVTPGMLAKRASQV